LFSFDPLLDETMLCPRSCRKYTADGRRYFSLHDPIEDKSEAVCHCHCPINPRSIQRREAKHEDLGRVKQLRLARFIAYTFFSKRAAVRKRAKNVGSVNHAKNVVRFSKKPSTDCFQGSLTVFPMEKYLDGYASLPGGKNVLTLNYQ
jgi:hypothetical protein